MTENIKSIVRDKLALRPLMSVQSLRTALLVHGYMNVHGGLLDWHYVSKIMRKVRMENIANLSDEDRAQRLTRLKERHRIITDALSDIVEGNRVMTDGDGARYPTVAERIAAANTIMKCDLAILFAEETLNRGIEKPEPVALVIRSNETSKTKRWARLMPKILST